jgi:dynein heavy chain 2
LLLPERAIQVQNRLKEVLSLRTLHKQLSQLLSISEQEELKTDKSFDPFNGLNPVHYNPYTGKDQASLV